MHFIVCTSDGVTTSRSWPTFNTLKQAQGNAWLQAYIFIYIIIVDLLSIFDPLINIYTHLYKYK